MKKLFLLLSIINFSLTIAFSQPAFVKDSLDKYVEREMKRWNVPGSAVAIVKDGKVVVMKGYGVREIKSPSPTPSPSGRGGNTKVPSGGEDLGEASVNETTIFQIASNTKAFTATSLALLDFQKRLSLDDKVTKWMPYFKLYDSLATKEVTIKDLLCHRIGFQTFQSDILNWNCNLSRKDLIHNMRNVKPMYSFRSRYGYTNMGFVTAGDIIPVVTDTSWDDFLKYRIFVPLKMNRTTTHNADIVKDNNAAKPYTLFDNKLTVLNYDNVDNIGPCASINSCVNDISHWIIAQLDSGYYDGNLILPYIAMMKTRRSEERRVG